MDEVISEIKKQLEKQKLSETKAAKMAGLEQSKVNRLLAGKVKKPDIEVIRKLQNALGIKPSSIDDDVLSTSKAAYPNLENMSLEDKIRFIGLSPRDTRILLEAMKMTEEERNELLKKMVNENLERGRY